MEGPRTTWRKRASLAAPILCHFNSSHRVRGHEPDLLSLVLPELLTHKNCETHWNDCCCLSHEEWRITVQWITETRVLKHFNADLPLPIHVTLSSSTLAVPFVSTLQIKIICKDNVLLFYAHEVCLDLFICLPNSSRPSFSSWSNILFSWDIFFRISFSEHLSVVNTLHVCFSENVFYFEKWFAEYTSLCWSFLLSVLWRYFSTAFWLPFLLLEEVCFLINYHSFAGHVFSIWLLFTASYYL